MYYEIEQRAIKEAESLLKSRGTVRSVALDFGVGKSTAHYDLTVRLKSIDGDLYEKVKRLLKVNLDERHIRGGIATREKFKAKKTAKTDKKA